MTSTSGYMDDEYDNVTEQDTPRPPRDVVDKHRTEPIVSLEGLAEYWEQACR